MTGASWAGHEHNWDIWNYVVSLRLNIWYIKYGIGNFATSDSNTLCVSRLKCLQTVIILNLSSNFKKGQGSCFIIYTIKFPDNSKYKILE